MEAEFQLAEFLKDYGGHILGLLALVQVWIIAVWKRYVRKGRLDLYPAGTIEIGFSTFGPTVNLGGTLRAQHDSVFVQRMGVRVIRLKDRAEHILDWRAFRPNVVTIAPNPTTTFSVAASFLVSTAVPRTYNVFFASQQFVADYQALVQPLRDTWQGFPQQVQQESTFGRFVAAKHGTDMHAAISHGFYWHAGEYELQLTVETSQARQHPVQRWRFTITAKDEQDLRLNIVSIIREIVGLPVLYNFAYKPYSAVQGAGHG